MGMKFMLVVLVLIALLFAAGIYMGQRPDDPTKPARNPDEPSPMLKRLTQAPVPPDEIVCACLAQKRLTIPAGATCRIEILTAKSRLGVRKLKLTLLQGAANVELAPSREDEQNPGPISAKLPTEEGEKSAEFPILRHGGRVTIQNIVPTAPCVLTME
jgi:hypothetical protein